MALLLPLLFRDTERAIVAGDEQMPPPLPLNMVVGRCGQGWQVVAGGRLQVCACVGRW